MLRSMISEMMKSIIPRYCASTREETLAWEGRGDRRDRSDVGRYGGGLIRLTSLGADHVLPGLPVASSLRPIDPAQPPAGSRERSRPRCRRRVELQRVSGPRCRGLSAPPADRP